MAKILRYESEIQNGLTIEPWHISQSVDALTGIEGYDINISGSLEVTGSTNIQGDITGTSKLTIGDNNSNTGNFSSIPGGSSNTISGDISVIGGGNGNESTSILSVIGGGSFNTTSGTNSTIGGGLYNEASGEVSTIGGGERNITTTFASTIGGGERNTTTGDFSTIGGGDCNTTSGELSTIGGGKGNIASGGCSSILGGASNNTNDKLNSHIIGSDIIAKSPNTTYVNNLHITGSTTSNAILQLSRRETTPTGAEGMIIASGSAGASKLYYYNGSTWNALF